MVITQIRFNNFTELKNRFRLKEDALGIPAYGELNRFGEFVGISAKYLSHLNARRKQIGHHGARKLESAFDLPVGWLDVAHPIHRPPTQQVDQIFIGLVMQAYAKWPEEFRNAVAAFLSKMLVESIRLNGRQ